MALSSKRGMIYPTRPVAIGVNPERGDSGKQDDGDQSRWTSTESKPDSLPR